MIGNQERFSTLPIRHDLSPIVFPSLAIAILIAIASVAGIVYRNIVYPTDELRRAFVSNDVVDLFLGMPLLLVSIRLAERGRMIGLLCWLGALFFVLYNYLVYVFAMPFNVAFFLHLALVSLSLYALISLLAGIDANAVRQRLTGSVHERTYGGILAGLELLFLLRAIGVLVHGLTTQALIARTELAVNIADILIIPSWIIGGVFLWQRKELGYVAGLGLLFQASMLFVGLIAFLLLQPFLTDANFKLTDVVAVSAMGLICFIPVARLLRGIRT